jgi:hypothetical protein
MCASRVSMHIDVTRHPVCTSIVPDASCVHVNHAQHVPTWASIMPNTSCMHSLDTPQCVLHARMHRGYARRPLWVCASRVCIDTEQSVQHAHVYWVCVEGVHEVCNVRVGVEGMCACKHGGQGFSKDLRRVCGCRGHACEHHRQKLSRACT